MSRQRDYQPTIDRARTQAEIAQRREAKLREKKDECHREMLRAQAASRIAGEEADALRDRNLGLEQSVRDLRKENVSHVKSLDVRAEIIIELQRQLEAARHPFRTIASRTREWFGSMLKAGEEA